METTRYRVGDATLTRVSYAEVVLPAEAVGVSAEQVAANEWATPTWADGDQVRAAAAVWIIESGGRTIVVDPAQTADDILRGDDAGFHQEAVATLLADAGYPRESVDTVIATHIDGIGMIAWRTDDGWEPFFPNASLLVSEPETAAIVEGGAYVPSGAEAFLALHDRGAITTVGDAHSVTGAVTTRFTGKHSPGHMVVDIAADDDRATMIGHLAINPVHCLIPEGRLHEDVPGAFGVLRSLADGRILIGPLWPTPGAIRWTGDTVEVAERSPS